MIMSAWRLHRRQSRAAGGRRGEGTGSAMVRRSMGRRCREAMRARAPRSHRANFAPAPTPMTPRHGRRASRARRIARVLAFACIAAIAVLSLLPGAERPHTGAPGRVEHFVAYGGTGFLLALGYLGWRQRLVAWIGLAAASGGIRDLAELHSRALAEPVRRSGEHRRLDSRDGGWRHPDRRSCLGPRGRAFEHRSRRRVLARLAVPPPA